MNSSYSLLLTSSPRYLVITGYRPISDIRLGLFSQPRSDLILSGVTLVWSYFGSYFGSWVILTSVGSYMQNASNQSPKVGLVWFCSCYQLPKQHMPTAIQQKGCKGKTPQIATASSSTGRYPSCDCCYDCCLNNGRAHANLLAATQICNNVPNNSSGIASCLVLENHPKHSLIVEILRSTLSRSNHIQLMGWICKLAELLRIIISNEMQSKLICVV